jgi:hypothetical protein
MRQRKRATPAVRSEFRFIARRLFLLDQHPAAHQQEIQCLEQARHEILQEWPFILSEFSLDELVGTGFECDR